MVPGLSRPALYRDPTSPIYYIAALSQSRVPIVPTLIVHPRSNTSPDPASWHRVWKCSVGSSTLSDVSRSVRRTTVRYSSVPRSRKTYNCSSSLVCLSVGVTLHRPAYHVTGSRRHIAVIWRAVSSLSTAVVLPTLPVLTPLANGPGHLATRI